MILVKCIGICPFLGVAKKTSTACGMGLAVLFVVTFSSFVTWLFQHWVLAPLGLEYLQTVAFILIIASLVQLTEMVLKRFMPPLYEALGIYLPLITTNCAVLYAALNGARDMGSLFSATVNGFMTAAGFLLALLLFNGVHQRLQQCEFPPSLKGVPAELISAGLLSMAFMGFQGFSL